MFFFQQVELETDLEQEKDEPSLLGLAAQVIKVISESQEKD